MNKLLSQQELQEAYLLHGADFDKFLNVPRHEMYKIIKENNLSHPTDYVRNLLNEGKGMRMILSLLRDLGTWKKVADRFSVSESFMRSCINKYIGEFDNQDFDLATFKSEIARLGSVALFSRCWNVKESSVRKWAEDHGVELPALISYDGTGFENAKGRKAEIIFATIRGNHIQKDMNKEDNQAPYDFIDDELHTVDVKSSQQYSYTSKKRHSYSRYWKFAVQNLSCDIVAFVAMDERYENMVEWFCVDRDWIPEGASTLTVNETVFSILDKTLGIHGMHKEQFNKYILNGSIEEIVPRDALRGR